MRCRHSGAVITPALPSIRTSAYHVYMRAMVLEHAAPVSNSPLKLRERQPPSPAERQVRVAVRCCGVCHTDLHTAEGDLKLPKLPLIPGHQVVGIVEACGSAARTFHEGDRVGVPWLFRTDGSCRYCLDDQENLCNRAEFTGLHADGGYAEYMVVDEEFAYSLPTTFDDSHVAPLLCAGVIGYRSFRLSGAKRGHRLGLYGFGASAHIVLQFARYQGCEVYVFSRGESHRQMARDLGAAWAGDADDSPDAILDAAIIFAPAGGLVPLALKASRKGATVAVAGISMSPLPELDYQLLYGERILRSVANSTRRDVEEFLELSAAVPVRTEVTEFPLTDANLALQKLKSSQINGAGVLRICV